MGEELCHSIIGTLARRAGVSKQDLAVVATLHDALRLHSLWSAEHGVRVGVHVRALAGVIGIAAREAATYGLCACLHDIGKLKVPMHILNKPDTLTKDERAVIEQHPSFGFRCIRHLSPALRIMAEAMIELHHENYDGSGYPLGLAGEEIPTSVHITHICDVYDAIRADRPYRRGMSREQAVAIMEENAALFHPGYFEAFKNNLETPALLPS
ncbi:HD domain-containing protein [Marivibrio halodurans]|uniref:HD domain-containing protein n=1 Tax=Marivibrio halodurans TaxID=2039722 RepID=A0A8J7V247_9PROT|nr:HD domain-containing phosphohydrolase [Marivibrio halodurans]MBP5856781.1 HD domain-containing protein [Marivibrio halodurans]